MRQIRAAHNERTALSKPQVETMPPVKTLESGKIRTRLPALNGACSAEFRLARVQPVPGTGEGRCAGALRAMYSAIPPRPVSAGLTRIRSAHRVFGTGSA